MLDVITFTSLLSLLLWSGMEFWECHVDSVERVTHDTNLYRVSFPVGATMQVPTGRHVFVTACVDGKSRSLSNVP